jgi:hypothetical protein
VRVINRLNAVESAPLSRRVRAENVPYWALVIARAVPALVIAAVITFSADHSTLLGFTLFAFFAVSSGIIVGLGGMLVRHSPLTTTLSIARGITGVVTGFVAAVAAIGGSGISIGRFIFLISASMAITGVLELYAGLRSTRVFAPKRDLVFVGALTVFFATAVLFIPLELRDPVTGQHGVEGYLTAPVVAVGLFGAYCAVIAVYLVIAGLSLKWEPPSNAALAAERVE